MSQDKKHFHEMFYDLPVYLLPFFINEHNR